MTRKQLTDFGFKIKGDRGTGYWYELKYKNYHFITCDNWFNKNKDEWNIGYVNLREKESTDYFWFNNKLLLPGSFTSVFFILTGKEFELPKRIKYKPKI